MEFENREYCKRECEFFNECHGNFEECFKKTVLDMLEDKSFYKRPKIAIIKTYGLDGNEPCNLKELAKIFNTSTGNTSHVLAKALRMLRHPHRSKVLRKYNVMACKHPDSKYSKLLFSIFGQKDTRFTILADDLAKMTDGRGVYSCIKELRKYLGIEAVIRLVDEIEEEYENQEILSIDKIKALNLDPSIVNQIENAALTVIYTLDETREEFKKIREGSQRAKEYMIRANRIWQLLFTKEVFLRYGEEKNVTFDELMEIGNKAIDEAISYYDYVNENGFMLYMLRTIWRHMRDELDIPYTTNK